MIDHLDFFTLGGRGGVTRGLLSCHANVFQPVSSRVTVMSHTKAALVSSVFLLAGCESPPDQGAPRAPLPSEVKPYAGPPAALTPEGQPRPANIAELRKANQAKNANAASGDPAKAAPTGAEAPKPGAP
jgi:hypothetical protein